MTNTHRTIWVLDDDASVCKALRRLIKSAGFSVKTYASAQKFIDDGHMKDSGLLILDVRMPGLSGLELQKQLVACGSKMPIIFITAHDDGEAYATAMENGAVAFLQKPFDVQDLLDAINAGLGSAWRHGSNETPIASTSPPFSKTGSATTA